MNIDYTFFDSMVNHIYPSDVQLNKANVSDTEASFLDLPLSISAGFVKTERTRVQGKTVKLLSTLIIT